MIIYIDDYGRREKILFVSSEIVHASQRKIQNNQENLK